MADRRPPRPATRGAIQTAGERSPTRPTQHPVERKRSPLPWGQVEPAANTASNVSLRVTERLAEKARANRRRRLGSFVRRMALVAALAGVTWVALLSPLFALEASKVRITDAGVMVDPQAIRAVIEPHYGTSLAMLNTGHLANQILAVPGVKDVTVERVWPAGLQVTVAAREHVAAIPEPGGGYVLVDGEGVQVGETATPPTDVPVIDVPIGPDHVRTLDAVLSVVHELPIDLRQRLEGISAHTEDSVTFVLRDGPRVEWGSAADSALKAEVLQVMMQSPVAMAVDVIDVSAPTLPITRSE